MGHGQGLCRRPGFVPLAGNPPDAPDDNLTVSREVSRRADHPAVLHMHVRDG